jgi:hypothetical protein
MQPAVMVGLISMMTGSALQEDIAATTRALLSKAPSGCVSLRLVRFPVGPSVIWCLSLAPFSRSYPYP